MHNLVPNLTVFTSACFACRFSVSRTSSACIACYFYLSAHLLLIGNCRNPPSHHHQSLGASHWYSNLFLYTEEGIFSSNNDAVKSKSKVATMFLFIVSFLVRMWQTMVFPEMEKIETHRIASTIHLSYCISASHLGIQSNY